MSYNNIAKTEQCGNIRRYVARKKYMSEQSIDDTVRECAECDRQNTDCAHYTPNNQASKCYVCRGNKAYYKQNK